MTFSRRWFRHGRRRHAGPRASGCGALLFLLDSGKGVYNVAAPEPVTNKDLSKALGRALKRPAVMPVPAFAIRALYGEMAFIVTTGVRAVPTRLMAAGYSFERPDLDDALRAAVG
jgi:NAD dependent epimerase/dehydratase family enzyme